MSKNKLERFAEILNSNGVELVKEPGTQNPLFWQVLIEGKEFESAPDFFERINAACMTVCLESLGMKVYDEEGKEMVLAPFGLQLMEESTPSKGKE